MKKKCNKHGRKVLILDKSQLDPQDRNLCIQCLTEQKMNFLDYKEVQMQFIDLKSQLIKEKKDENEKNISLLMYIKDNRWQLKTKITSLIDKISIALNNKFIQYQIPRLNMKDKLRNYKQQILMNLSNNFWKQKSYKLIKDLFLKNLSSLQNDSVLQKFREIFAKINAGMQNYSNNILSKFKQQFIIQQMDNNSLSIQVANNIQVLKLSWSTQMKHKYVQIYQFVSTVLANILQNIYRLISLKDYGNSICKKNKLLVMLRQRRLKKKQKLNILLSNFQQGISSLITKSTNQINDRSKSQQILLQKLCEQDKSYHSTLKKIMINLKILLKQQVDQKTRIVDKLFGKQLRFLEQTELIINI